MILCAIKAQKILTVELKKNIDLMKRGKTLVFIEIKLIILSLIC